MFLYENHLDGGVYASEYELDYDQLYCEECGDCDWLIGEADTREEAYKLLESNIDKDGEGGWDPDYIDGILNSYFSEEDEEFEDEDEDEDCAYGYDVDPTECQGIPGSIECLACRGE